MTTCGGAARSLPVHILCLVLGTGNHNCPTWHAASLASEKYAQNTCSCPCPSDCDTQMEQWRRAGMSQLTAPSQWRNGWDAKRGETMTVKGEDKSASPPGSSSTATTSWTTTPPTTATSTSSPPHWSCTHKVTTLMGVRKKNNANSEC